MTQYSLAYDSSGNSSLVATKQQTTSRISSGGDWKVSDYFAPRMDYGITETYKNNPEEQLKTIQKVLVPQSDSGDSKDDKDYKKDLSPAFNWKDYMYEEYKKALGVEAADAWLSAYNLEKTASAIGWIPFVPSIVKVIAKGTQKYQEKKKENIVKQYINSKYFMDNMANMDIEYTVTGDYDEYNDLSWHPSYGKDYKPGTVFDAEDHGEPPAGVDPSTVTIQDVDDYGTYEPSTPKHHGDSHQQTFSGGSEGGEFDTSNNNTGSSYSRPGATGHPTGHHW